MSKERVKMGNTLAYVHMKDCCKARFDNNRNISYKRGDEIMCYACESRYILDKARNNLFFWKKLPSLEEKAKKISVLPQIVENEQEKVCEVIFCDSISGGADYYEDMPKRLTLTRDRLNGESITRTYVQERLWEKRFGRRMPEGEGCLREKDA